MRKNAILCGNGLTLALMTKFRIFQTESTADQKFKIHVGSQEFNVCLFGVLCHHQQYFSYLMQTVHKSMFPGLSFYQYLTSPLSRHWWASCSAIPKILHAKGGGKEKPLLPVLTTSVCGGRGPNPQPPALTISC